jgi:putative endonuclease
MYFLYILRCCDNSLYCGQTKDLKRRINEHNSEKSKSKYTRSRRPVKLVYFERHPILQDVLKREIIYKK